MSSVRFPKAVLFDLDDTLINHTRALEQALGSVYTNYSELSAAYDLKGLIDTWKESLRWQFKNLPGDKLSEQQRRIGRIREIWRPVRSDLSDEFCLRVTAEYLRVYQENWRVHEDVSAALQDFSGVPLAVVTNGYVVQQNEKLRQCGLHPRFNVVVTSEEAGVGKPAPFIFHLACQKLEVQPSDAAYVGDNLETDALGAQDAGLQGIWLNREGQSDNRASRVRTITSLAALKPLLV